MPSGKTHTRINFISFPAIVIALIAWGLTDTIFYLFFGLGFVIGTYFITPDMDIKSDSYRKWGKLRFIWYPYMKIVPHRSFLSHTIIIGDLFRIAYLLVFLSPILYLVNRFILDGNLFVFVGDNKFSLLSFVVGIMTASALHIVADKISTGRKRMKSKRKRKRKRK